MGAAADGDVTFAVLAGEGGCGFFHCGDEPFSGAFGKIVVGAVQMDGAADLHLAFAAIRCSEPHEEFVDPIGGDGGWKVDFEPKSHAGVPEMRQCFLCHPAAHPCGWLGSARPRPNLLVEVGGVEGLAQADVGFECGSNQLGVGLGACRCGNVTHVVAVGDPFRDDGRPKVPDFADVVDEVAEPPAWAGRDRGGEVGVADEAEELGAVDSNVVECVVEKGRRLGHDANRTNSMPTPRCV